VDELIEPLSASGCGCHIGRMFYGCIMYADGLLLLSPTLTGLQSMFHVCDSYAKDHNLVFNVKKTCCAVIGKHRSVIRRLVLAEQAVPWTDRLRYLGVSFTCSNTLDVDVSPVRRNLYAACNSIIARSRGTSEPVRVQLVKSYCLPLLVYCIGALRLKRSAVHQLSVCWNDAFRKIFNYKRYESVKLLQVEFGTMDFNHLYDLHRWNFLQSLCSRCAEWSNFVKMMDMEFHCCRDLMDFYMNDNGCNVRDCIRCHCRMLALE